MQTKLSETTAIGGFGSPTGKKLLKVKSGKYAGRMIAVYKTSNNEIKYSYSNSPFNSWSTPTTVVSDSANDTFDIAMNDVGDVYLVYCEISTNYLVSVKLTINDSNWTIGSHVYVYNNGITNAPSLAIDSSGVLYVSFARYNISVFDLHVKTSTDDAITWGISPSDNGDIIATGLAITIPKIMTSDNNLFVVYVADWNAVKVRSRLLNNSSWSTEYTIASSANIDEHFDAIVLPGGFVGVVYDDNQLNYREYDGKNWSPITVLDSSESFFPQITLINNIPVVLFLSEFNTNQFQLKQTNRQTGTFSTPILMEHRSSSFDSVILYDSNSSSYEEKTTEAANSTAGDIFHSVSSQLCSVVTDKIYCGSDSRFRFLRMILSTVGVGGSVTFSYFDGSNWKSFIPSSGAYNLDVSEKEIFFWDDFDSTPQNWQKNIINNINRYWVKIEVSSTFTTSPIGTQLTSISQLESVSVRR